MARSSPCSRGSGCKAGQALIDKRRKLIDEAGLITTRFAISVMAMFNVAGCGNRNDDVVRKPHEYKYAESAESRPCQASAPAGRDERGGWRVRDAGFSYMVKAPANYRPERRHPLLVVYAPAGASAEDTERYVKLTPPATRQGVIVAYVDHRPLSPRSAKAMSNVPGHVAKRWCIDERRVYFAGHSDGGTVSTAIALLPETRGMATAIAVSGAGMRRSDAEELGCPKPLPVMLMHGARDKHFPGWGGEMAAWWAHCNRCETAAAPDADGCVSFQGCAPDAPVVYCEGPQTHEQWPGRQDRIIKFLLGSATSVDHGVR